MPSSAHQVPRGSPTKRALRSSHSQRSTRSPSPFSPNTSHNEMPVAISSTNGDAAVKPAPPRRRSSRLSKQLMPNGSLVTPSASISELESTVSESVVGEAHTTPVAVPVPEQPAVVEAHAPVVATPAAPKIDWEVPRKAFHSSIGVAVIALYLSNPSIPPIVALLFIVLVFISICDFIRLRHPPFEALYEKAVGFLMRESEKKKINGTVWYLIGVIFVLSVYPTDIAVVSILILSWADTAASTIGRLWGRYTRPLPRRIPYIRLKFAPRKSTAGYAAAFLTGGVIASSFLGLHAARAPESIVLRNGTSMGKTWDWSQRVGGNWAGLVVLGLWSGFVTAVSEALDLGDMDDNLTLPVLSGAGIWAYIALLRVIDSRLSKGLVVGI